MTDWIDNAVENDKMYSQENKTFDEAVETVISLEGKRFSPLLTARLRDKDVAEKLKIAFKESREEGCKNLYNVKKIHAKK